MNAVMPAHRATRIMKISELKLTAKSAVMEVNPARNRPP